MHRDRVWGTFTALLKEGEVVQLKLDRSFRDVGEALRSLKRKDTEDTQRGE